MEIPRSTRKFNPKEAGPSKEVIVYGDTTLNLETATIQLPAGTKLTLVGYYGLSVRLTINGIDGLDLTIPTSLAEQIEIED